MVSTDPFSFRGGDIGCLLIHGFSGNPADLRPLADQLAAQGYTVDLPLLPGHGLTAAGAGSARWRDWVESVAHVHDGLQRSCRQVVIVGYSMGGSLAIVESARCMPAALALLSVPTFVSRDWRTPLLPIGKYLIRWWYPLASADFNDPLLRANLLRKRPDLDLDDPRVQAQLRRTERIPTAAIDHFFRLTRRARRLIPTITAPTLVAHGSHDQTALPVCAEEIYRRLGSQRKELIWFERSGHQLVNGPESAAVVERIVRWVGAQVGQPGPVPMD